MESSILLPVNSSALSYHIAEYTVRFAEQMQIKTIILYASEYQPWIIDGDTIYEGSFSRLYLKKICDTLQLFSEQIRTPPNYKLNFIIKADFLPILAGIHEIMANHEVAFMIALRNRLTIGLSKLIELPFILVPCDYIFKGISAILSPSDSLSFHQEQLFDQIEKIITEFPVKIMINRFVAYVSDLRSLSTVQHMEEFLEKCQGVAFLNNVAEELNVDLILLLRKEMNVFRFSGQAESWRKIVKTSEKPILIL